MSENNRTFEDVTREAREQIDKAETFLNKQANELRKTISHQLREASKNINKQVEGRDLDAEQRAQVSKVLNRLDELSGYLENHTIEEMEQHATKAVQEHVWRNLVFAIIIGMFLGIFFNRRD